MAGLLFAFGLAGRFAAAGGVVTTAFGGHIVLLADTRDRLAECDDVDGDAAGAGVPAAAGGDCGHAVGDGGAGVAGIDADGDAAGGARDGVQNARAEVEPEGGPGDEAGRVPVGVYECGAAGDDGDVDVRVLRGCNGDR